MPYRPNFTPDVPYLNLDPADSADDYISTSQFASTEVTLKDTSSVLPKMFFPFYTPQAQEYSNLQLGGNSTTNEIDVLAKKMYGVGKLIQRVSFPTVCSLNYYFSAALQTPSTAPLEAIPVAGYLKSDADLSQAGAIQVAEYMTLTLSTMYNNDKTDFYECTGHSNVIFHPHGTSQPFFGFIVMNRSFGSTGTNVKSHFTLMSLAHRLHLSDVDAFDPNAN